MEAEAASAETTVSKDWAKRFRISGLETWTGILAFCSIVTGFIAMVPYLADNIVAQEAKGSFLFYIPFLVTVVGISIAKMSRVVRLNVLKIRGQDVDFSEIFIYLFVGLILLATLCFISANSLPASEANAISQQRAIVLLFCLVLVFLPVGTACALKEKANIDAYNADRLTRPKSFFRQDAISAWTLGIGASLLLLMIWLAWAMGAKKFAGVMNQAYFSLGWIILVIGVFLVFVFAPHIRRAYNDFKEHRAFNRVAPAGVVDISFLPRWASYLDSTLVRVFAPMTGATQSGAGVPHVLVIGIMMLLATMGFALPSPFGLAPIGLAILLALALGRRWAWIESDRDTAARLQDTDSEQIHIGFDNDLRDEALLGYTALFILVPLGLYQLEPSVGGFEATENQTGVAIVDWLRFFGAELAKAVPFVDWWEIYRNEMDSGYEPTTDSAVGMHLTFAARAIVDLVIMAALFQAIGISQRTRQQEKLYKAGEVNAFDPFKERDFFESGVMEVSKETFTSLKNATQEIGGRKISRRTFISDFDSGKTKYFEIKEPFAKLLGEHLTMRRKHSTASCPYNQARLSKLQHSEYDDLRAGAKWMIANFHVLVGSPEDKIQQLRDRWRQFLANSERNEAQTPFAEARLSDPLYRQQKDDFESVVDETLRSKRPLGDQTIDDLVELIAAVNGHGSFEYATGLAFSVLGKQNRPAALIALAVNALEPKHRKELTHLGEHFPFELETKKQFQEKAHMRQRAVLEIDRLRTNSDDDFISKQARIILDMLARDEGGDRSKDVRDEIRTKLNATT